MAASSRSKASPASNGISICRRWRLLNAPLSICPAIRCTRLRCEIAPATTSTIVTIPSSTIGNSSWPINGMLEYSAATSSTARPQTMAMRRTKNRLLNMGVSGRGWIAVKHSERSTAVAGVCDGSRHAAMKAAGCRIGSAWCGRFPRAGRGFPCAIRWKRRVMPLEIRRPAVPCGRLAGSLRYPARDGARHGPGSRRQPAGRCIALIDSRRAPVGATTVEWFARVYPRKPGALRSAAGLIYAAQGVARCQRPCRAASSRVVSGSGGESTMTDSQQEHR